MSIGASFLPEYEHEMSTTRKFLERVPDEKWDWKPDPKSMTLGGLSTHIAQMQAWGEDTMKLPKYDLAGYKPPKLDNKAALLAAFDTGVARFKAAMAAARDEEWTAPWSLTSGDHVIFAMPRVGAIRSMIFNHTIHHRGQLSVYFRLLGVPVPGAYGPSADEM
ncbi:MAG: DinB family protein [Bryobacteraceae bacterium]